MQQRQQKQQFSRASSLRHWAHDWSINRERERESGSWVPGKSYHQLLLLHVNKLKTLTFRKMYPWLRLGSHGSNCNESSSYSYKLFSIDQHVILHIQHFQMLLMFSTYQHLCWWSKGLLLHQGCHSIGFDSHQEFPIQWRISTEIYQKLWQNQ
jgi:hypothetical protein